MEERDFRCADGHDGAMKRLNQERNLYYFEVVFLTNRTRDKRGIQYTTLPRGF